MKTWGEYARRWQTDDRWPPIEDPTVSEADRKLYLEHLGDEWGDKPSVDQFVADFVIPYLATQATALEIGCGGGRIARRVASRCRRLACLDIDMDMLRRCVHATRALENVAVVLSADRSPSLPFQSESVDFVYSFDTFVHLDQRMVYGSLLEAARVLRRGCKAVIHVASHETDGGWRHFAGSVTAGEAAGDFGSFEYIDSRAFLRLASRSGFTCIGTSLGKSGNYYYDRDVVFVLEKL
jgi:SAM-dependent methyltransferase